MNEREIFDKALSIENTSERSLFLDKTCVSDIALREHLEELLSAHARLGNFLEVPMVALDGASNGLLHEQPGSMIGPYKLLEAIGEGGFGVVFMAEQVRPICRRIALKVIKPGMDTRLVVARFEAERQALALMDHPNIARVFDAGATDSGRPYFVMELVRGVPITVFCDQHQLPIRERLALFITTCLAVQHAHQKGIIHRDIKPSNVLITNHDGTPVPKVIDFGVAKALRGQLTDKTLFTGFSQLVGTPLYMSPEQTELSGLDVDTRSDVYSLGVLLYELLTGTTPFEKGRLVEAGYDEMRRIIREEEPAKPSTRVSTLGQAASTIATQRGSSPLALVQLCHGELDWIVMKALEKDRRRRYETAAALAADVENYLQGEVVAACPPSTLYRFRKFTRRNKVALTTGLLVVAALALGTIVSTHQAIRATEAEALAELRLEGEKREREQSVQSKLAAKRQLLAARLAQAQALRMSRQPGQRFESWRAVTEAAGLAREMGLIEEHLAELRDTAIACLTVPDIRPLRQRWEVSPDAAALHIEFDADLKHYARSLQDGTVTVHTMDDGRELARLTVTGASELTFSPDGKYLAVQHRWGVRVWNWSGGVTAFDVPTPAYNFAIGFSPDCKLLAVGFRDRTLALYDLPKGTERLRVPIGVPPMHVAFHPTDAVLAVSGGYEVHVRDLTELNWVRQMMHPATVHRVAWHEDGKLLASACDDHQVYVWDTTTGRVQLKVPHTAPRRVAFVAQSNLLFSWGWDDTCRAWDPSTGRELVQVLAADGQVSRDGRQLATHTGRHLAHWELAPSAAYRTLSRRRLAEQENFWEGDISPDSRWLVQGSDQGIRLWDLLRAKEMAFLPAYDARPRIDELPLSDPKDVAFFPVSRVSDAKFDPSGRALFTSGPGGCYRRTLEVQDGVLRIGPADKLLVRGFFERIGFDRSTSTLAVANLHAGVRVLDLEKAAAKERSFFHNRAAWAAVSPDGAWIVSGTQNGRGIKVWDTASAKETYDLAPANRAAMVKFSPDGRWLLTATNTEFALWTAGAWKRALQIPRDQSFNVGSAAFSRDGKVLAVTLLPSTVDLVDPATGRQLVRLQALETGWLTLIGFSPDGSQLAAWGPADTCVWDLRHIGEQLHQIGLDWDLPLLPPAQTSGDVLRVEQVGSVQSPDAAAHIEWANALASGAQWSKAAAELTIAASLDPSNQKSWYDLSVLYLATDDIAGYRRACREMLTRFGQTDDPHSADRIAKTCSLAHAAVTDYAPVLRLAERAVTGTEAHPHYRWFALARGITEYRVGNFTAAIDWLEKSIGPDAESKYRDGLSYLFVAMAHHRLGQAERARQALQRAREMEQQLPQLEAGDQSWSDVLRYHIVRREAEEMFKEKNDG